MRAYLISLFALSSPALAKFCIPKNTTSTTSLTPTSTAAPCIFETCPPSGTIPGVAGQSASAFCSSYLSISTVTVTAYQTQINNLTVTPAAVSTYDATELTISTELVGVVCTTSTMTNEAFPTFVEYPTLVPDGPQKREPSLYQTSDSSPQPTTTDIVGSLCGTSPVPTILSSACSCIATTPTTTVSVTATVSQTQVASTPVVDLTSTIEEFVTVTQCTSTSTVVSTLYATPITCGVTFTEKPSSSTSGSIVCSSVPTPSAINLFRIEGDDNTGTIFEQCILSGPRDVTTPSGGTHLCDGTNDNANPMPGTTPTDFIDAAARQNGFGYDGTYESQFQDYFISSIGGVTQFSDEYWGVLSNLVFTPTSGCQYEVNPGDRTQWIFNAFNFNSFLSLSPDYAVAQAGQGTVQVTVSATDGNGDGFAPQSGASIAGLTTDGNGNVQIPVPSTPGCYQYKATQNGAARSNAFYLTVYA